MHRGLSSVMINYARSISDEKKAKTIVKGNKSGEITGSSDDMQCHGILKSITWMVRVITPF